VENRANRAWQARAEVHHPVGFDRHTSSRAFVSALDTQNGYGIVHATDHGLEIAAYRRGWTIAKAVRLTPGGLVSCGGVLELVLQLSHVCFGVLVRPRAHTDLPCLVSAQVGISKLILMAR
jgi:hypothetical protein